MKRFLYIFVILIAISSCTLETSDNGKLDGYWHLERIDTIPTGGANDLSESRMFWAVENKLLQLQGGSANYSFRFTNSGDSLILTEPYQVMGTTETGERADEPVTDPQGLRQYGVNHLTERYRKETYTGSRMVLRTDSFRLHFRKF